MDISFSLLNARADSADLPFAPTLSNLFVPVTGYSKLVRPRPQDPCKAAPAAVPTDLDARLRIAARRAWVNYRRDAAAGYEMSQAILRDCGGRRDFTRPRWVGQQLRRGQALERLVADGFVEPGMVLWFSNDPGSDPNRLDPGCNHLFYICVGRDARGLVEFAGAEGDRIPCETVAARLRLGGCALDKTFAFVLL